jgi:hypothetical protein
MDLGRIQRIEREVPYVAVGICDTGHNTHTGVVYRDHGTVRFLEQGFHYDTRNEPVQNSIQQHDGPFLFTVPDLDDDRARNVAGMCRLIAKWLVDKRLPGFAYALKLDEDARFDPYTGELAMASGVGLNCSTFVIVVFRSSRVRFIDFENWPVRPGDVVAQERLVSILEAWRDQGRASPDHVEKVRNEIGCVRARPEEVAGACIMDLPGKYPAIERAGKAVLTALDALR